MTTTETASSWIDVRQIIFPIGYIYTSTDPESPATLFGGSWTPIEKRFLYCRAPDQAPSLKKIGGQATHSHKYGIQYGAYYGDTILEQDKSSGLVNYNSKNSVSIQGADTADRVGGSTCNVNANTKNDSNAQESVAHYKIVAQNEYVSSLPPYKEVYAWERIA